MRQQFSSRQSQAVPFQPAAVALPEVDFGSAAASSSQGLDEDVFLGKHNSPAQRIEDGAIASNSNLGQRRQASFAALFMKCSLVRQQAFSPQAEVAGQQLVETSLQLKSMQITFGLASLFVIVKVELVVPGRQ